jgi:DNA-binding transcriptional MerR regulator
VIRLDKSPDAFRTISEAAEELDLPQHVLRFWETRFATIKPLKRGGGRRYYRPEDVMLLKGIRHLLYDQGFTIKGVQRILKEKGARHVAAIAGGGPIDAVPMADDAPEPVIDRDAIIPADDDFPEPMLERPSGPAVLTASDREKLNAVLKELYDCKRILERARES